jgi:hypothetical protein
MPGYDRDMLEEMARASVSAEDYYDLIDSMSEMSDEELMDIPGVRKSLRVGV